MNDPRSGRSRSPGPGRPGVGGPEVRVSADRGGDGADVIESAAASRPRLGTGWAVAAAVAVGGVAGYLLGVQHAGSPGASPGSDRALSPSAALPPGQPALNGTGNRCAIQLGANRLQLGVELANSSGAAATINTVDTKLPLGGLQQLDSALGSCGQLAPARASGYRLAAGATTWLTVTFQVLEPCPAPIPVAFVLGYEQAGRVDDAQVPAFADLGDVAYSGCPGSPSG